VTKTIPIRRRLVGEALRRYREGRAFTLEDAARILSCDRSKISRIETGDRGIQAADLVKLLNEYGVPAAQRDVLHSIAWKRGAYGGWDDYRDVLPAGFAELLIIESVASEIVVYQPQQVPALLQTEDYARAIAAASPDVPVAWEDKVVEAVLARQQLILAQRQSPVDVLISEAAIRQPVGTRRVMRDQLIRLAHGAVNDPTVTIRVIPFSARANAGLVIGSTTLLRLSDAMPDFGVVHLDGLAGGTFLNDPASVAAYSGALGKVRESALSPPESAELITALSRE
jgi:transcriptional regulator with XRE-family HTH domain